MGDVATNQGMVGCYTIQGAFESTCSLVEGGNCQHNLCVRTYILSLKRNSPLLCSSLNPPLSLLSLWTINSHLHLFHLLGACWSSDHLFYPPCAEWRAAKPRVGIQCSLSTVEHVLWVRKKASRCCTQCPPRSQIRFQIASTWFTAFAFTSSTLLLLVLLLLLHLAGIVCLRSMSLVRCFPLLLLRITSPSRHARGYTR